MSARKNNITGTISVFAPFYPSSLQFHALKGTVAVLFKAEHSVKMTIVINWGAPMVDHIIGLTPDLTTGKFASLFANPVKSRPTP